ncbi:hypothetical protein [Haloarcula onubensis]|uniref:DUF8009 domain-containing protein n=1 Tax=Haloarcula onubensis TaxID=2950539 RepID=A0ABU2FTG4_9EURY|nr:hypothetical protein [Halomicroarcula sp. S3CR25-11]MDS0284058.1 hypothetical protein [Halomicroarcula sp. S3CR25-11]
MTHATTDDSDAKGSEISTVRISFEALKTAIRSRQDQQNQTIAVIRISPTMDGFDDVETARIEREDTRTVYPDGKPHIDIHPCLLVGGERRAETPELAQYPDRLDQRAQCRDSHGLDAEDDMGELWDEWWSRVLDVWESELKSALRDEVDLDGDANGPTASSVTLDIEWTDID